MTPDGRIFLNHDYLMAGIGNVKARLNTGNATTYYQCNLRDRYFYFIKRMVILYLFNQDPNQIYCLFGCSFTFLMNPGTMFPQVSHFTHKWIQTRFSASFSESRLMHSW